MGSASWDSFAPETIGEVTARIAPIPPEQIDQGNAFSSERDVLCPHADQNIAFDLLKATCLMSSTALAWTAGMGGNR